MIRTWYKTTNQQGHLPQAHKHTHELYHTFYPSTCTPTTHPSSTNQATTTVVQQQWSSTYRPIYNGSTEQYGSTRHSGTPVVRGTPGAWWDLRFLTIFHLPGESASRRPPSTHHPPPTRRPTHHHSSTTAGEHYVSTNAQRQHSTYYTRSWVLGGICTIFRFSTFRGEAPAVPGRGFSCPPLAELGLVGRCVAVATEGLCVGRAGHGRAVARGQVASGRAGSCKCIVFRVGLNAPLRCEASHVTNILANFLLLKVLGRSPGISRGPTSIPPPRVTCGTVQLFFEFLLRHIIFGSSARFASCLAEYDLQDLHN